MRLLGPKWVQPANSWCVTIFVTPEKSKATQTQEWFSTKEEAEAFIKAKDVKN